MSECSVMSDSAISWTIALQASLSMEFLRQEYWSGLPFLTPGDLPDPGIELESCVSCIGRQVLLPLSHLENLLLCIVCWSLSRVPLSATPWIVIHQAPLSMGFSRQGYQSGLPCPSPYFVLGYSQLTIL